MRRVLSAVPVLGFTVGIALATASPALAHGAQSDITLATTTQSGAVTVNATVAYLDGDPVPDALLTAVAQDGSHSTSITMNHAAEPGHYTGTARLDSGDWKVTVKSTGTSDDPDEAIGQAVTTVRLGSDSSTPWVAIGAGAAGVILVAGAVTVYLRRRRPASDESPADELAGTPR